MDFTAGLMPLETALTQMLNRVSPLHDVETLPLVRSGDPAAGEAFRQQRQPAAGTPARARRHAPEKNRRVVSISSAAFWRATRTASWK
ncbi:hypothetical protein L1887_52449 [Cichorium endivia]|nr:hypothetical protein L1887_52449 [Cichorium endivia]